MEKFHMVKKTNRPIAFLLMSACLVLSAAHCTLAPTQRVSTATQVPTAPVSESTPNSYPPSTITVENVSQLQEVAQLGKGNIRMTALAPDGETLAVVSSAGVYLYNIETLEEKRLDSDSDVLKVAFDPSGSLLAVASRTLLQIWDLSMMQLVHTLDKAGPFISIAFDTEGKRLASGGEFTVQIWDMESGNLLQELHTGSAKVLTVAFSPDGTQLISGGGYGDSDHTLQLWDLNSGSIVYNLDDSQIVEHAAFRPNRSQVAAANSVRITLWDTSNGTYLDGFLIAGSGPTQPSTDSFVFGPDGKTIIGDGWPIRLWSVHGKQLDALSQEAEEVILHPDGRRIISRLDSTFSIWDLNTKKLEREFTLPEYVGWIYDLAFSPDGSGLATASSDNILRIWDVETGELQHFKKAGYPIWLVTYHPDGEILAYGGCSMFHRDGNCIRGEVTLWDIEKRRIIGDFTHDRLNTIAFNPNGQTLAASALAYQAAIRLYDLHSDAVKDLDQDCYNFVFSPDGSTIAAFCSDSSSSRIDLLDAENGDLLRVFNDTHSVADISQSGELLVATFYQSNKIQILDIFGESENPALYELETNGESVSSAAFGVDRQLLAAAIKGSDASSSIENTGLELWDVIEGKLLFTVDTTFLEMSFSPEGHHLATGGFSGIVHLWGVR
jgi:WD40 repeat protein